MGSWEDERDGNKMFPESLYLSSSPARDIPLPEEYNDIGEPAPSCRHQNSHDS